VYQALENLRNVFSQRGSFATALLAGAGYFASALFSQNGAIKKCSMTRQLPGSGTRRG
jgi:hypothetical protein